MIQLILVVSIFLVSQYGHIEVGLPNLPLLPQEAEELFSDLLHAVEDELKASTFTSVVSQLDIGFQNRKHIIQLILLQNTQFVLSRMKQTVDA